MVRFSCPCGKQLQAKEEHAGQHTRCPDCGRDLLIPGVDTAYQAAPTPPVQEHVQAVRPEPRQSDDDEPRRRRQDEGTSGKAIASLVFGLLAIVPCSVLAGIPAVIFGILGLRDIGKSRGARRGQGLAIAGMVMGGLSFVLLLFVVPMILGLTLPAVQKVREAANRANSQNHLKQIGLALHNYHDAHGQLPPSVVYSQDGRPLHSWRVLILPYLGHDQLYRQFKLDEPWDSAQNKALLPRMPEVYLDKGRADLDVGMTTYLAFDGKGAAFESDPQTGLAPLPNHPGLFQTRVQPRIPASFMDGTSNTAMVAEAEDPVLWTKPQDLSFLPNGPLPKLGSKHGSGFNVLFVDGSVRNFKKGSLSDATLRAIITRNGNEVVELP